MRLKPIPSSHLLATGILLLGIVIDQVSKYYAQSLLTKQPKSHYLGGLVVFEYAENNLGFLGVFKTIPEPYRFIILTAGIGAMLLFGSALLLSRHTLKRTELFAIALLLAGGTGNLIDRLINNGHVIDFIRLGYGSVYTGIFNIADIFVMFGGFLFGYSFMQRSHIS